MPCFCLISARISSLLSISSKSTFWRLINLLNSGLLVDIIFLIKSKSSLQKYLDWILNLFKNGNLLLRSARKSKRLLSFGTLLIIISLRLYFGNGVSSQILIKSLIILYLIIHLFLFSDIKSTEALPNELGSHVNLLKNLSVTLLHR